MAEAAIHKKSVELGAMRNKCEWARCWKHGTEMHCQECMNNKYVSAVMMIGIYWTYDWVRKVYVGG